MNRICLSMSIGSVAAIAFGVLSATTPVVAACYEDVGCTNDHVMSYPALQDLSCEQLWTVRNAIFQENGFCFQTKRALAVFSNDGCTSHVSGDLPLNHFEQTNVSRVIKIERQKACH